MMTPEQHTEIRRLFFADHHTINAIATSLGLHHETVQRALGTSSFNARAAAVRQSILDPFVPLLETTLETVPRIRATRMTEILRDRGFVGSVYLVRRLLRQRRRSKSEEAHFRLTVFPGDQAQCDWGHFGTLEVGKARRKLSCFVMVLSYSRHIYAGFTFDQSLESFLRQHVAAFRAFKGVPRTILYDNLKTAVIERVGSAVRFHPALLEVAGHYHFKPKPCQPRRPQHKGRVERAIGYLRTSFFPARHFRDLDDANRQLAHWLAEVANVRTWPQDRSRHVNDVLAEDSERLLALAAHDIDSWHLRSVRSDKTAFVRFDLNDYSIPPELCRKPLTLLASDVEIRILDGDAVVATHLRSYDKGFQAEDRAHVEALLSRRRQALPGRRRESLIEVIPAAQRLLEMLADRGERLAGHLRRLYDLVEEYGISAVERAIVAAIDRQTPRSESVAHLLGKSESRLQKGLPSLYIDLPDRPGVRDLVIRHHSLEQYDTPRTSSESKESEP